MYGGTVLPSPLCITFQQISAYICNTCINLLDNDKEILEKYSKIWNQIKKLFEKKFDSEPLCNDKYIKAKINSYNANFYGNKTTIEGVH